MGMNDNDNIIKGNGAVMNRDTSDFSLPVIPFNTTATYMGSLKQFNTNPEPKKSIIDKYKDSTIKEFNLTTNYI